ncbi:hypothetical protein [Natrinema sp. HArc-T2]|uniref:hypothetical protein n=1 Tax=Natrinema sp. HArc-T2 TaxID=3242701 RepID=UPI00359D06B9
MVEGTESQSSEDNSGTEQRYESRETTQSKRGQAPAPGAEESITDAVQRPGPQQFIRGIAGLMGAMGALLGLGVYLVAQIGGRSLLPGIVSEFSGTSGVEETLAATHQLTIAYMANELAIFLAFLMAPLFGFLVAFKMDDTKQAKMGAAGVGVAVGTVAFTFIVVIIASMVTPSAGDVMSAANSLDGASGASTEAEMVQGMDLGSINIGNTVVNSALVGIPAGIAAAAVIYFDEEFF